MNVRAPMSGQISGQVPSQAGLQLSGLSQQNGSSLPPQMQNLGNIGTMDPDLLVARKLMQDKIIQFFQNKRPSSSAEWSQRLPDVARRLEEYLFKDAATKEDFMNMDTLESRLLAMTRRLPNHSQPMGHHLSSSSPVSTMIPTPGMPHSNNSNSTVSRSVDNPMFNTGTVGTAAQNILPTANGTTGIGHSASDGTLLNGYQQSPANMSIGSGRNNIMSSMGVQCLPSQMIPTPGLNIPESMSVNSECTTGRFSGVETAMVAHQQPQKQYVGNQNSRILHGLGAQMGVGLRSSMQQKLSPYGFLNGVVDGGLASIAKNMQLVNGPATSEGRMSVPPYGSSPKPLQQHIDQQHHQSISTTSSSQKTFPMAGEGHGMSAADLSGAGNTYGSATSVEPIKNNENMSSMNLQSKSQLNPSLQTHLPDLQSMQQSAHIKPSSFEHSQKMKLQATHQTLEHLQSQQQVPKFQQQQQFQQLSSQPFVQFVQHQQQQQMQNQQFIPVSDSLRYSSLTSSLGGQIMTENGIDTHKPLLPQAPEQFHLPEFQGQLLQNASAEDRSNGAPLIGHFSGSQDFQTSFFQGSQQMHQNLHPHLQIAESQNDSNCLSTGPQPDMLVQGQWHPQVLQKSHIPQQSSHEQHIQDDFHQRIIGQDEALQPHFSLEGSIVGRAAAAAINVTGPQSSGVLSCGPGSSMRERQYLNQRRWILFLCHARWCSAPKGKCQEVNCITVQQLWSHMGSCNRDQCGYPRCRQSMVLLKHYHDCRAGDCPVCVPVRHFITSRRRACNDPPPVADATKSMSSAWKNINALDADRLIPNTGALTIETSEDLQSSMKRIKAEHPSFLMLKSENSADSISLINEAHASQEEQPQGHQQFTMSSSTKSEVAEVKIEPSTISGFENFSHFSHFNLDDSEDAYGVKPDVEPVVLNEHDVNAKQESMQIDGEIDLAALEVKQDANAPSADPVASTKSGKPKIKGVSLTELFTPEQIREHIIGLRQWVGQSKAKAEKNQAMEHSMSENSCQLCAVEKLTFEPPPIYCSPCGARIKRNAMYYTIGTGDTRHYFCIPCYNETRGDSIEVEGIAFLKAKLEKKKNDEETEEWWVQCDKCEAWQHQICTLFNGRRNDGGQAEYTCPNCYVQEIERGERMPLPQSAVLGAKDLPRTLLSDHIEQRLFRKLKQERQERARHLGKNVDEVLGAEALVVRVVSSVDKKLEVKQRFLEIFQEENYPTEFSYKSKVILLFQKIEGVEVCLFGMYVQEFGSECQFPNQRRVYLSYLDSVKYFRPETRTVTGEALRTFVYHEILMGYLEYCKKRGFTSCYIWACPPLKGEDYILYCHPEIQKTPKSDKLREWYLSMLRKAAKENIVVDLTNLYDHFFITMGECKAKVTATRLPYFDGDYWPGAAEDMINQLQQEEDGRKQQKKGKSKKTITKRALKAAGQSDLSGNASKDALLMQKLGETICPMKEDFIMVHLQRACTHCCLLMVSGTCWVCNQCKNFQLCDKCHDAEQKLEERDRHPINGREKHVLSPVEINDVSSDTKDKDEILESEFFDTRQAFLSLCQGNHYQYDTLRRAKHSSMMVLYHLHNPTAPAFVTTCIVCHNDIETGQGWRCEICPDFDVCNGCYQRDGGVDHPHRLTNHPSNADRDAQNKEARQKRVLQLRKMLDLLVHASQCRYPHCQYPNCRKVKGLFRHGINCKVRASGGCLLCKKMWYLLQLHARACKESECHVPRCRDLKEHLRRLQQQSDSRRRAAVMEMMRQRAAEVAGNS